MTRGCPQADAKAGPSDPVIPNGRVNRFPDRQLGRVPIEEHLQSIQCVGDGPSHNGKRYIYFIEVMNRRLFDLT